MPMMDRWSRVEDDARNVRSILRVILTVKARYVKLRVDDREVERKRETDDNITSVAPDRSMISSKGLRTSTGDDGKVSAEVLPNTELWSSLPPSELARSLSGISIHEDKPQDKAAGIDVEYDNRDLQEDRDEELSEILEYEWDTVTA
ncbi:MAG: hypothetical protein Q9182_004956 [Xanthomendoza sp. 2 TL-2023]